QQPTPKGDLIDRAGPAVTRLEVAHALRAALVDAPKLAVADRDHDAVAESADLVLIRIRGAVQMMAPRAGWGAVGAPDETGLVPAHDVQPPWPLDHGEDVPDRSVETDGGLRGGARAPDAMHGHHVDGVADPRERRAKLGIHVRQRERPFRGPVRTQPIAVV